MDDNYGTDQLGIDSEDIKDFSEVEEEDSELDEEADPLDVPSDGSFGGDENSDQAEIYNAIFEYQGYDER